MSRLKLALCLAPLLPSLLAPSPALAETTLRPLFGAELGQSHERLSAKLPGYSAQQDRWMWQGSLLLGLGVGLPPLGETALRADTTLTWGKVLHTGHHRLSLREDGLASFALGAGFHALAGPGLGLVLDPSQPSLSSFEASLSLGLRFRPVELLYRPAIALPLGKEESALFGGQREHGARPGLVPLSIVLRVGL